MKEVTRTEFHQKVLTLNVHPHLAGSYPYTSIMRTPFGQECGRIVETCPPGTYPPKKQYFLPE